MLIIKTESVPVQHAAGTIVCISKCQFIVLLYPSVLIICGMQLKFLKRGIFADTTYWKENILVKENRTKD